ncbi:hypothetical protein AB5N19_09874 [Seiridium cardinale]
MAGGLGQLLPVTFCYGLSCGYGSALTCYTGGGKLYSIYSWKLSKAKTSSIPEDAESLGN